MTKLCVGDVVEPKDEQDYLACGSGIYPHAVVIQVNPFLITSKESDMLWSLKDPDTFRVIGKAPKNILKRCMRRLHG